GHDMALQRDTIIGQSRSAAFVSKYLTGAAIRMMAEAGLLYRLAVDDHLFAQGLDELGCRGDSETAIAFRKPRAHRGPCLLFGQTVDLLQPGQKLHCILVAFLVADARDDVPLRVGIEMSPPVAE